MEKNLPLATALRSCIYITAAPPLTDADQKAEQTMWEAVSILCPHPSYVHGGSMGDVCSVCGLMPPDADVQPADSADLDLAAELVGESHPGLSLRLVARAAIIAEVEQA